MPQTITLDQRRSTRRPDLDSSAGEVTAANDGDFARGQRHDRLDAHAYGDFATGLRTTRAPSVTGDFATGMRSSQQLTTIGDFATGMRNHSTPVASRKFRSRVSALPVPA